MPEYIEREALTIENLEKYKIVMEVNTKEYGQQVVVAVDDLMYLPTADVVEVKHGEWQSLDRDHFSCTQCGHIFALGSTATIYNVKQQWQYCPKCGAKMDGKEVDYA